MKRSELKAAVYETKQDYKASLQTLWNSINKGQQKQLEKNPSIKAILDRFMVETE